MLRCAVIDSGVDPEHPLLRSRVDVVAAPSPVEPSNRDELGHGTAVAATIVQFLPPEQRLEVVSVRVFGTTPTCDFSRVLQALDTALQHQPAIINLSLGTTALRHRPQLQAFLQRARDAGCAVVAPASYAGLPCDPGVLPEVEGVVGDANVLPQQPELRPHGERLLWFASPLPPRNADGQRTLQARGESLAVAAVTGALLRRAT